LNTSDLNISKPNDAWILHREEITTLKEGNCNVYVVLDAHTGFCFGMETSVDLPSATKITGILKDAFNKSAAWPKKMLISKKDPYVETLTGICDELKVDWLDVPAKYLEVFVKPFKDSFRGFKVGGREQSPASEIERKEMEAFTPETLGPAHVLLEKSISFAVKKHLSLSSLLCVTLKMVAGNQHFVTCKRLKLRLAELPKWFVGML